MSTGFGLVVFLLIVGSASLLILLLARRAAERRLVEKRLSLRGNSQEDARLLSLRLADLFDDQERIRAHINKDQELALAMWRAGLRSPAQRATLYGVQVMLPLIVIGLAALWGLVNGFSENVLLMGLSVIIVSVLVPKRVVTSMAETRIRGIDDELSLFVQMLRILFDAGLAVEQSLRVLVRDAGDVLPEMVRELAPVLRRAEQGLDLESELNVASTTLDHVGFTDVMVIVRQMLKQGGSARESLTKLIEVIESRRLTTLQEKVSKLSAKMTVVMIVFFFPALIILLAGPGFISIGGAMRDM